MTAGVRVALLYAALMLLALAVVSALTPTAPLAVRLVISHALVGGTVALLAWILLAGSDSSGSFPSLVNAKE